MALALTGDPEIDAALERRDLVTILRAWRDEPRAQALLQDHPEGCVEAGALLLRMDEPIAAHELLETTERGLAARAREGGLVWRAWLRAGHLRALALARCGASDLALEHLAALKAELAAHPDPELSREVLGLEGRVYKDRALALPPGAERTAALKVALSAYAAAQDPLQVDAWIAINVATLALLSGQESEARHQAGLAEQVCRVQRERGDEGYWNLATLGEAALLAGDAEAALDWYRCAARVGARGEINTTWRNARLIAEQRGLDLAPLDAALRRPRVSVFTGHMVDRPDRPQPRFPAGLVERARAALREAVQRLDVQIGYAMPACGGDLLFLEAVLARGGEVRIVLPYQKEVFFRHSVGHAGPEWAGLFERVLAAASEVIVTSDLASFEDASFYRYANLVLLGLATEHARRLDTRLAPIALWDRRPGDGIGGTAEAVQMWRNRGLAVEVIEPVVLAGGPSPEVEHHPVPVRRDQAQLRVLSILFADAAGFSKLGEAQIRDFVVDLLGRIDDALVRGGRRLVYRNTWGDGLFLAFPDAAEAARGALDIAAAVAAAPASGGIRGLRVGVHAGPVWQLRDPVTGRDTLFGSHVTEAARIEPGVSEGQVWASHPFAALLALEDAPDLVCEYIGQKVLAKRYGTRTLFRLRRSGRPEPARRPSASEVF